jgi:hypothetical protein
MIHRIGLGGHQELPACGIPECAMHQPTPGALQLFDGKSQFLRCFYA